MLTSRPLPSTTSKLDATELALVAHKDVLLVGTWLRTRVAANLGNNGEQDIFEVRQCVLVLLKNNHRRLAYVVAHRPALWARGDLGHNLWDVVPRPLLAKRCPKLLCVGAADCLGVANSVPLELLVRVHNNFVAHSATAFL